MPKKNLSGQQRRRAATAGVAPAATVSNAADAKYLAFQRRRRRRFIATGLFILAGLVVVSHLFEHLGFLRLMSPTAQDVFVGYPTAIVLAVIGGILWGV